MQKIIVDKEMLAKLHDLRERLELCDENGRCLAVVQPKPERDRDFLQSMEIPISEEELQRIESEIGKVKGYTTAEVLAHLKNLEHQ